MAEKIDSIERVIDLVGGEARAARLADVGETAVANWKARGRIAKEHFVVFAAEVAKAGKEVDPRVFGLRVR